MIFAPKPSVHAQGGVPLRGTRRWLLSPSSVVSFFLPCCLRLFSIFLPFILFFQLCMEWCWGFFKHCTHCGSKLAPSDSHKRCLFCLDEAHQVDSCATCQKFSLRTQRTRLAHLCTALMEESLAPHATEPSTAVSMSTSALIPKALFWPQHPHKVTEHQRH